MSRTADYSGGAAGPITFGTSPGSGLVAYPVECYQSKLLDLTTTALLELMPAKPSHFPIILQANWLIETFAGTQTVNGTGKLGSNPTHDNFLAALGQPAIASVNAITTLPCMLGGNGLALPAFTVQRIPNAPVMLELTSGSAGTGGFVLKGKLAIVVYWAPGGG